VTSPCICPLNQCARRCHKNGTLSAVEKVPNTSAGSVSAQLKMCWGL